MFSNISKSLLAQARINTFIFFYDYLQKPKAKRLKGFLSQKWKKHMLNLINVYISIRQAVPEYLSFSCIPQDMSSRGTLRLLSLLFLSLPISRSLLEVPLKFYLQIPPLPWNDTILHFIQEETLVVCLPNPHLDDNQRNSYLQPDSRRIFTVIWEDTITRWLCNHLSYNVSVASYLDKHSSPSPHISQDHCCWATLQVPYLYFPLACAAMVGSFFT